MTNMHLPGTLLVVLVACLSVIEFIQCEDDPMNKIFERTNNILKHYDDSLYKSVPFKEFKQALKIMDDMVNQYKYEGPSRNAILEASALGYEAADEYGKAADIIYEWCITMDEMFANAFENYELNKETISQQLSYSIDEGLNKTQEAMKNLNVVRDKMRKMAAKLKPVPSGLKNELEDLRRQNKMHPRYARQLYMYHWTLTTFYNVMIEITKLILRLPVQVMNVINFQSEIRQLGVSQDIIKCVEDPNDNNNVETPTKDDSFKVTEAYFKGLILAVVNVQGNVTDVQNKLANEIRQVSELKGRVHFGKTILALAENGGYGKNDQFCNLRSSVKNFIKRHNTVYEDAGKDSSESQRRKRHINNKRDILGNGNLDDDGISVRGSEYFMNSSRAEQESRYSGHSLLKMMTL